jgi:hypothetical protein
MGAVAVFLLTAATAGAYAATGAPLSGERVGDTPGTPGEYIGSTWRGDTAHLDWRGGTYSTSEASFVGHRVTSPGDRIERTLDVSNNGPSGATMTVWLRLDMSVYEAGVYTPAAPHPAAYDPAYCRDIVFHWQVGGLAGASSDTCSLIAAHQATDTTGALADPAATGNGIEIGQVWVPRGGTAAVTVGASKSAAVTHQHQDSPGADVHAFDVLIAMQGDTDPSPTPTPTATPTATPTGRPTTPARPTVTPSAGDPSRGGDGPAQPDDDDILLFFTGGDDSWWFSPNTPPVRPLRLYATGIALGALAAAAAALTGGWWLLAADHRRRDDVTVIVVDSADGSLAHGNRPHGRRAGHHTTGSRP